MIPEQQVPAILAALLGEGVSAATIERAVARTASLSLGRDISGLSECPEETAPLVRAFIFEQAGRLS